MKRISTFAVSFLFAAVFAVSAFAQVQPAAAKIGWINTAAFSDEKEGVTKYINGDKALKAEMKPRVTELEGLQTRLKTLSDDLTKMTSNPAVPFNQQAAQAKQDEGQRLQREFEFKKKELEAAVEKRRGEILGPVSEDIGKALDVYAKQKGYAVLLDIAALVSAGAVLVMDPSADVTKDFITYYNTRPATTATTATPR
jgi:Skp family chaperone for outer membrane proteins